MWRVCGKKAQKKEEQSKYTYPFYKPLSAYRGKNMFLLIKKYIYNVEPQVKSAAGDTVH